MKNTTTKIFIKVILVFLAVFYAFMPAYAEDLIVEAEGIGTTKMEAMNNAWTEAVRKAVGVFINAKDTLKDENLIEQISTYSRGKVNSYTILNENKENGLWKLKISAKIDKDVLQEAKVSRKTSKVSADQIAQFATASNQQKDANDLIENFDPLASNSISDFLDYQTVTEMGKDGKLRCIHLLKINDNYKNVFIPQMDKLLSELATKKAKKRIEDSPREIGYRESKYKKTIESINNFKDSIIEKQSIEAFNKSRVIFGIEKRSEKYWLKKDDNYIFSGWYNDTDCYDIEAEFDSSGNSNGSKFLLFTDGIRYTRYDIDKEIVNKIYEKFNNKKYELGFVCKSIINGEEQIFDSPFIGLKFFFCNARGVRGSLPVIFNDWNWDGSNKFHGSFALIYIQIIDIPSDKLNKIESMEFSYEIQEK